MVRTLAACALLFPAAVSAQIDFTGGEVLATPGAPSETLYAYRNGLFKSTDLGRTWIPLYLTEPGLPQPAALFLVIDPSNAGNLFLASTAAAGMVWKSTDAGTTWTRANAGLPDTGAAPTYFAWNATNRSLYLRAGRTLYKSSDGAATWNAQSTLPGLGRGFDISRSTPSRMYYGQDETVYRTDDEGKTWTSITALFPPPETIGVRTTIGVIGIDPVNPSVVIASMGGPDSSRLGIYRSENSAGSFSRVYQGYIVGFHAGPQGPYYGNSGTGGTVRSNNGGASWSSLPLGYDIDAVDPRSGAVIYAGLARSTDAGDTWSPLTGTVTPTLSKQAAPLETSLEEGLQGVAPLAVEALEFSRWSFPFTASTSGEPWLSLDVTQGNSPRTLSVRISAAGLAIGRYTASITLSAPATANKSVVIPLRLTVIPRDAGRPNYTISTLTTPADGISLPSHVVTDGANLYIAQSSRRIWRLPVSPPGRPVVFAGNGETGGEGDGGSAVAAQLSFLDGLALGPGNALYVSERTNRRIRRISAGTITLVADRSTRVDGSTGTFLGASGIAVDGAGRLLLAANDRVLRLSPNGTSLESIAVNVSPALRSAEGIAVDAAGNIYVSSPTLHRVYRVSPQNNATVVAGAGTAGFAGDGGPATAAALNSPSGIALDREGNLYICDERNHRIRMVTPDGMIRTIAGTGVDSNTGDGGPAHAAGLWSPASVAVDTGGNVYFTTLGSVRKLTRVAANAPGVAGAANAASGSAKVAPGGIVSIYGQNLASETLVTSSATWPETLGGTSVTVNGRAAPIWFVSAGQINAQVPVETPLGMAQVAVTASGVTTAAVSLQVAPAAPGLLACPSCGAGHALAVNPGGALNSTANPAQPGQTIVVYLAGVGPVEGIVRTGEPSPASPLPAATLAHSITLGGQPVSYVYLGLTPTFVALAQANLTIPDLPPGEYPLVITINGEASNALNISVGP
ncbi:MAG: hypothetical protein R2762_19140 [Bryobacteraceae bacterium]